MIQIGRDGGIFHYPCSICTPLCKWEQPRNVAAGQALNAWKKEIQRGGMALQRKAASQVEIFERKTELCDVHVRSSMMRLLYRGRKWMLSMDPLPTKSSMLGVFSRRRVPGLLLTVLLSGTSQVGQGSDIHWTHAEALSHVHEFQQRIASNEKCIEVELGAELKDGVNGVVHQCKARLN